MPYRRVLAVALGGIGDVLMAEPAVRLLRQEAGLERLGVLAHGHAGPLLGPWSRTERLFAWDASEYRGPVGQLRLMRDLRRERFEAALCLWPSSSLKCVLIPVLAGVPVRFIHAYRQGHGRYLARVAARRAPYRPAAHRVERNVDLVAGALRVPPAAGAPLGLNGLDGPATGEPGPLRPRLFLAPQDRLAARALLETLGRDPGRPLVALHPGCTPAREALRRRWPMESFARLAEDLTLRSGVQILLVAGPGEREEAAAFAEAMAAQAALARGLAVPSLMLAGCRDLRTVAAALAEADLVVSNDSGIGHLAAAVGTTVVSLFGPTAPAEVRPFGGGPVVTSPLECSPCIADLRPGPRRCDAPCMRAIRPETVFEKIAGLLASRQRREQATGTRQQATGVVNGIISAAS